MALLRDLIGHAVLGAIRDFLRRPLAFCCFLQVVIPSFTADSGALEHAVRAKGFGFFTGPLAFSLGADLVAPTCAAGLPNILFVALYL